MLKAAVDTVFFPFLSFEVFSRMYLLIAFPTQLLCMSNWISERPLMAEHSDP